MEMKLLQLHYLWRLLPLIGLSSAITLLEVLGSYPELSTLQSLIANSTNATSLIASANNFTFLAPSNDAIESFNSQNSKNLTGDLFEANVQYSLLRGGFPTLSFTDAPQFVASNLENASYANVTGGQVVELVLDGSGTPEVVTGNKTNSTSTSTDIICSGGIVHIINDVLALPVQTVQQITVAKLEFFIAILNTGGFLNTANSGYVEGVMQIPDVTYFIPNSAVALEKSKKLSGNSSSEEQQAIFQYHVVPGFVGYSPLLENGMSLKTVQGTNLTVNIQDGVTYVNAVKIIATDYLVANGVVHVIDDLLDRFNTFPPLAPRPSTVSSSTPNSTPTNIPIPTPTVSAPSEPNSTPPPAGGSSNSNSSGLKIGAGVGASAAGLLIIAAIIWFFRSRKQKRDSRVWDDRSLSTAPDDFGKPYYMGGKTQRPQSLGMGSTGMNEIQIAHMENVNSKTATQYSATISGPSIPPRSPSRLTAVREYF